MKPVKMKVCSLIFDGDLYPRRNIDTHAVRQMVRSLEAGAANDFPPIIIDKKTKKIIDGYHRCKAFLQYFGEDAEIWCEVKSYPNDKAIFLDAMKYNARHGIKMDRYDRVHCAIRAKALRIPFKDVARALSEPLDKFKKLVKERTVKAPPTMSDDTMKNGTSVIEPDHDMPVKRIVDHMEEFTEEQVEAHKKLGGMDQKFVVNQLLILIGADMVNTGDEKLMLKLQELLVALKKFLAAVKRAG